MSSALIRLTCLMLTGFGVFYSEFALADPVPTELIPVNNVLLSHSSESWQEVKVQLDAYGEDQGAKEVLLREWLKDHPGDEEALTYLARVLAWQSKYAESQSVYDQLLSLSPENSDYLLGKAQVLIWQGNPADALPMLDKAQSISPNYEDVYRAKLQVYSRLGKTNELKTLQIETKTRFPDKDWELAAQPEEFPLELEAGGGYEHLTNRYKDWHQQYFSFRKPFSKRAGIYGDVIHTERFDLHDMGLSGGLYFPILKSRWGATLEGGISPSNRVLPRWSAGGSIQRELPWGFVASAGYRHTEYRDAITEMGIYRLENYWKRFRSSYTLFQGYLHQGGQAFSHMAELDYTYGERSHIGINGVLGEELANIGNAGVLRTDVQAASLFGLQMIRKNLGLTYRILIHKQGDLYTRRGFQLGLRYFL